MLFFPNDSEKPKLIIPTADEVSKYAPPTALSEDDFFDYMENGLPVVRKPVGIKDIKD